MFAKRLYLRDMKFFKKRNQAIQMWTLRRDIWSTFSAIIANIEFLNKVDLIGKKYEIIQILESKNIYFISNSKISKS